MTLRSYKLVKGEGDQNKGEGCWMSIGRWMVGELGWTDKADCISPIINSFCIKINDILNDADRLKIIGPRLLDPFGSAGSRELEYKRARWLVQQMSPILNRSPLHYILSVQTEIARGLGRCNVVLCADYVISYEYVQRVLGPVPAVVIEDRPFVEEYLLPTMYHLIDMGKKAPVEQVNACELECVT